MSRLPDAKAVHDQTLQQEGSAQERLHPGYHPYPSANGRPQKGLEETTDTF